MSELGDYFFCIDRDRQIRILKERALSKERPYIDRAFKIINKGNSITRREEQYEKARQVLEVAAALAEKPALAGGAAKNEELPFSLPESSILVNEFMKRILPRVNELRRELWGSEKAPFPLHPAKALQWLEKTAAEQNAPIEKRRADTRAQSEALMRKIGELIGEYQNLTGYQVGIDHSQGTWVSIAGKDHAKREGIITFAGTSLLKLAAVAKELSEGRAFMPSAIVRFIMTGIRPVFLTYHMMARKESLPRESDPLKTTQIKLELWRPLKKEEMKALYFEIKAVFGKRDKTFFKEKNRRLYELVEKHGGAPDRDRAAFWTTIMKEWNVRNPKAKYTTANGPRIAYKRILSRTQ